MSIETEKKQVVEVVQRNPWLGTILPWFLFFAVMFILVDSCRHSEKAQRELLNNIKITQDSVKHFKDKNGQLVSERESIQITVKDLERENEQLGIDKSTLKDQVGNLNNLVSYYKGQIQVKGRGEVKGKDSIIYVREKDKDSLVREIGKKFNFDNRFLKLNIFYKPLQDSLDISYSYNANFSLTTYYKRVPAIFGTKKLFADVRFNDPNARMIGNVQSIVVEQPPKKLIQKNGFWAGVGFVVAVVLRLLLK